MDPQLEAAIRRLIESVTSLASAVGIPEPVLRQFNDQVREMAEAMQGATSVTDGFFRLLQTEAGKYSQIIFRLNALNSSVYGATEAFTSVIPAVDAVSGGFKKLTEFVGKAAGVFGQTLGSLISRPLQLFSAGLEFAVDSLKFQIESAQKVANAFLDLTKAGALFSASIGTFYNNARTLGLPIQTFSKIVTTNAENIAKLGIGMQAGGVQVAEFTSNIAKSGSRVDDALIALYGNLESLSEGVADYLALQTQIGVNLQESVHQERLKTGAVSEYLIRQKELSALTGKNAKAMAEEEAKRRTELDYSLKLSRLTNKNAQDNVTEGIAIATKLFGTEAGQVAKEFFAGEGALVTPAALQFAGANAEAMQAIARIMGSVNQDTSAFRQNYKDLIEQNRKSWVATAEAGEDLYTINRAAANPLLTTMGNVNSAVLANRNLMENIGALQEQLRKDREGLGRALDPETNAFVQSVKSNLETQKELDREIMKNMGNMNQITQAFGILTRSMVAFQGQMFGIVMRAFSAINREGGDTFADLGRVFESLMIEMRRFLEPNGTPTPASGAPAAGANPPRRPATPLPLPPGAAPEYPATGGDLPVPEGAEPEPGRPVGRRNARGGLVNEPTIVGEAGPERLVGDLVFPYDRPVPIQVDWSPLIAAMEENNAAARELVALNEDNLRMQRQLLDAVS